MIYTQNGNTRSKVELYDMRHTPDPVEKISITNGMEFNRLKL